MDWRVKAAQHAAERMAALVHHEMAQGLDGLATVAATAPFVGLFGTCYGIATSFRGGGGEKSAMLGFLAELLSEAIIPSALGLAVAVVASCGYRSLRARMACFDVEMANAASEIPDILSRVAWTGV